MKGYGGRVRLEGLDLKEESFALQMLLSRQSEAAKGQGTYKWLQCRKFMSSTLGVDL